MTGAPSQLSWSSAGQLGKDPIKDAACGSLATQRNAWEVRDGAQPISAGGSADPTLAANKSNGATGLAVILPQSPSSSHEAPPVSAQGSLISADSPLRSPFRWMQRHGTDQSNNGKLQKNVSGMSGQFASQRNSRYKLTNKKLLEAMLDETTRRSLKTSTLCVDVLSLRGRVLWLVRTRGFTFVVSMLVLLNAAFIGVETEARLCNEEVKYDAWYAVQVFFVIAFLTELGLRLYAERGIFIYDKWNIFDLALVSLSVAETFVLTHLLQGSRRSLNLLVVLRFFRLVRFVRIFRLLRFFKELWFLVAGIFDAVRTLAWAWLLILFLTYIPAIFATRMFGKNHEEDEQLQKHFSTVPRSMYTLFTVMSGEGWATVARHTISVEHWSWVFFIAFIFATTFAIMHVVVAVIVQNTLEHASHCKEEHAQIKEQREKQVLMKIVQVFEEADIDGDGELTRLEFLKSLDNAKVLQHLHDINVDIRQAENLFDILDYDCSGSLDACEFIEGVMMARGEAKAKDILAVQCDMWRVENRLLDKVELVDKKADKEFDMLLDTIASFTRDVKLEPKLPEPERRAEPTSTTISTVKPHRMRCLLCVVIKRAQGLRDADHYTKSDAYCICEVVEDPECRFQTAVVNDDLSPVWDCSLNIADFIVGHTLLFTVWDKDLWPKKDDLLGRATLRSQQFYPGGFDGELVLVDAGTDPDKPASLHVQVTATAVEQAECAESEKGDSLRASLTKNSLHAKSWKS